MVQTRIVRGRSGADEWDTYGAEVADWEAGAGEQRYGAEYDYRGRRDLVNDEIDDWTRARDTFWQNQQNQFNRLSYGTDLGAGLV